MKKRFFEASSTLIGTIIGAGILGIPFVIMKSGFSIGLFYLAFVAALMIITHLYLGEVSLRTKGTHQLTGYAEKYLGKKGKSLMMFGLAFGIYSALLAYLIGEGISLSYLFFNSDQYALQFGLAFWVILSAFSYFGLKSLRKGETIGVLSIIALVILIIVSFWNKIDVSNLTYTNYENFFVPFGVILFAYLGFAAIPEVGRILKKDKKSTKKVIITSNLVVLAIYVIFTLIVLGSLGAETPKLATIPLGNIFVLLGILTMLTSYLALSIALTDAFKFDYNFSHKKSWLYTISVPIIIYLILEFFNISNFTKVLGIGGTIAGGLTAILILLMVEKAKKKGERKPEYEIPIPRILKWILIAIFVIGALAEIIGSF